MAFAPTVETEVVFHSTLTFLSIDGAVFVQFAVKVGLVCQGTGLG